MTADMETKLLVTIERLRQSRQGASDAEIHEIIIAAGLRALQPNAELIEWKKAGPEYPVGDAECLLQVADHFSPWTVWGGYRHADGRWYLNEGDLVPDDCLLHWATMPEGPQ